MSKYRFKTREEFIRDGLWNKEDNCPHEWAWGGEMNKYLGMDVPDELNVYCNKKEDFQYDGWYFRHDEYVLKEQQQYFPDLSQHIGRYIRALVDNPFSGSGVKKGDVGKIISDCRADFPNRKAYSCTLALSKKHLGVTYELLPEDYSPEQEPSLEFIPEKWYTKPKTNEEKDVLNKFVVDLKDNHWKIEDKHSYEHTPHFKNRNYQRATWIGYEDNDYTEITFEQFKKYVLKDKSVTPTDTVKYVMTTSEEAVFVSTVVESVPISILNVEDSKILPLPKSIESVKTKLN